MSTHQIMKTNIKTRKVSFCKLSTIYRKINTAYGRLKTLTNLAQIFKRYVVKVLDTEVKISKLEDLRLQVSLARTEQITQAKRKTATHITPAEIASDFSLYISTLEPRLLELLGMNEIKIILKEIFDDCISVLTDKGHIQYEVGGWQATCKSGLIVKTMHLDLAIESLLFNEDRTIGWN